VFDFWGNANMIWNGHMCYLMVETGMEYFSIVPHP